METNINQPGDEGSITIKDNQINTSYNGITTRDSQPSERNNLIGKTVTLENNTQTNIGGQEITHLGLGSFLLCRR